MALRHLSLRNFVIVSELELDLSPGFSVLTGETGAGKSILVDALQLILGGRGDALWVQEGRARCEIAAEFDTPLFVMPWLAENALDASGDILLIRRSIDATGKSRAWINGSPVTLAQLRELGNGLVEIHGQHAWQSLTRANGARELLDGFAQVDHARLSTHWQAWQLALSTLKTAQAMQDSLASERERLQWQLSELERLAPKDGEWDELDQRHRRLSSAQALIDAAQAASVALQDTDQDSGALAAIACAQQALQSHRGIEPEFATLLDVLLAGQAQLQDLVHSLNAYVRRGEPDPAQLAALDERISQWVSLARRFRVPPPDLPALWARWQGELARLAEATDLEHQQELVKRTHASWLALAEEVSGLRTAAAPKLAASITSAMQGLGMAGGVFEVHIEPLRDPSAHGLDGIQFLIAGHPGATPRTIDRVASGGELSRLALAIAVTVSNLGQAATLVFDEVDVGIGGAVAATVGRLLHDLGQTRQVLCVTHLAQVAACADHHLQVKKDRDAQGLALSTVVPVIGEARTNEIARMLAGEQISAATLAHAKELLAGISDDPVMHPPVRAKPVEVRS